jgi:AcrR family transcriptional regulator
VIKERIILAFLDLAGERGFSKTTMDELAKKAGMSKRTVYRHYKNKEEVIEAVLGHIMDKIDNILEDITREESDPEAIIRHAFREFYSCLKIVLSPQTISDLFQHYPHLREKIEKFRAKTVMKLLQAVLEKKDTRLNPNLDPRVITTSFLAAFQAIINPDFILQNEMSVPEALGQLMELFLFGIMKNRGAIKGG